MPRKPQGQGSAWDQWGHYSTECVFWCRVVDEGRPGPSRGRSVQRREFGAVAELLDREQCDPVGLVVRLRGLFGDDPVLGCPHRRELSPVWPPSDFEYPHSQRVIGIGKAHYDDVWHFVWPRAVGICPEACRII